MAKDSNNELTALQNFEKNLNSEFNLNIKIKLWYHQDQRKKAKFILTKNDTSISPALNYDNMNHFLLGIMSSKKYKL
jgi:hypothetical protein